MSSQSGPGRPRAQYAQNVALASTVSQVGCVTVVVIIAALLLGLWLDGLLNTRPILTIVCILVSIPLSLYSAVRIALSAAARIQPPSKPGGTSDQDKGEAA